MDQLQQRAANLRSDINKSLETLGLAKLKHELKELQAQMAKADFWQDQAKAGQVSQAEATLNRRINPWQQLDDELNELLGLIELKDPELNSELSLQLDKLDKSYQNLKKELRFKGEYDERDVILSISAGAGGTDAQDWAQMLMRMYVRWAEAEHLKIKTLDQSTGDEAGIKSCTLEIAGGSFLYGKLAGENGVHRLVRLSPFNADNLRQTSFAKVEVIPVIDKPEEVQIDEKDLKIDVFRSGGAGGQSVNTTDSAVRVTHVPTGMSVAIQNERSQLQNKETALTILRSRLAALQAEQLASSIAQLKGPNQSAEWGNQIRNYVLHPYKMVKDLKSGYETSDPDKVLDGHLQPLIDAYLETNLTA